MNIKSQSGQVVLLIVMLVAVVTTVALTLSFRSQTDIQLGRLNVESVTLREAAEGGVELGLTFPQPNIVRTYAQLNYTNATLPGVDLNKSRVIVSSNPADTSLVSPVLSNNGMFTFYLVPVTNLQTVTFQDTSFGRNLDVFYSDLGGTCGEIALEATVITDTAAGGATNYVIQSRFIADQGNFVDIDSTGDIYQGTANQTLPIVSGGTNTTFRCRARVPGGNLYGGRILLVRVLTTTAGRQTRLGFQAENPSPLPVQKRSVRSEVWSTDGFVSITVADQSYPQLPADFFVTSF